MSRFHRCDYHSEHSADDRPTGDRCPAPATHQIVWLDGTRRFSYGCDAHLELDPEAPRHRIEKLSPRAATQRDLRKRRA